MSIQIDLRGLEPLLKKLDSIKGNDALKGVMTAAASDLKSWVAVYPAAGEGNSPSNAGGRWYERGYGPRWKRKDGSVGGKRTSQTLGRRWTIEVMDQGMAARIGNNATYGPFVQDAERQNRAHKAHGWRTVQDAIKVKGPEIIEKMRAAIDRLLGG
uniref:Tail protein n=1 Tax=viral metagenome TaxID=1070528 RepID=A0A6M3KQL4_9ZZZZ